MTDVKEPIVSGDGTGEGSTVVPGTKTDPALLLESLKEEREKRRLAEDAKITAEADLKKLQDALASGDTLSEEGKVLKGQIEELTGKITSITEEKTLLDLQMKFPVLKDKVSEFKEFKKLYPAVTDESVAKLFLSENNLLEVPTPRKGVERPSGGGRNAQPRGMTIAEADDLRKSDFRKYSQMLKEGKLNDLVE